MIHLDSTTKILRIRRGHAATTNEGQVEVNYMDRTATAYGPGHPQQAATNGTSNVTICNSPGASITRDVHDINLYNNDTVGDNFIIALWDGATETILQNVVLLTKETLHYAHGRGWTSTDANANEKTSANGAGGRLINTQVITSGTVYNATPGTNTALVECWAGGGGGGGVSAGGVGTGNVGGGGASGAYCSKLFTNLSSPSLAIGSGGTAGSSAGGNGGDGGDTTFTAGGVTITAKGGKGGTGDATPLASSTTPGGAGQLSTNGDVNGSGSPGGAGTVFVTATLGVSGIGGSSPIGGGGVSQTAEGAGNAGTGHASGGSGGLSLAAGSSHTGGAGTGGLIRVWEYS